MTNPLDELYNRDPLQLNETDLDALVADLRTKRKTWTEKTNARKAPAKKSPKTAAEVEAGLANLQINLNLGGTPNV